MSLSVKQKSQETLECRVKIEWQPHHSESMSAQLIVHDDFNASLLCSRIIDSTTDKITSRPIPPNTPIKLVFDTGSDSGECDIWSGVIDSFIAFHNGLDEYSISNLHLIQTQSQRRSERHVVHHPVKLKYFGIENNLQELYLLKGCEMSHSGLGVWIPAEHAQHFSKGKTFHFSIDSYNAPFDSYITCKCVNILQDGFNQGIIVGLEFPELDANQKYQLTQLILHCSTNNSEPLPYHMKHKLAKYWVSGIVT